MIHGVGEGTHDLYIYPEVHQSLVDYLGERQDSIWTAPVGTVAPVPARQYRNRPDRTSVIDGCSPLVSTFICAYPT